MALAFFTRRWAANRAAQMPEPHAKELQLRVIYDPKIKGKNIADIDLVLVHGFGGDFMETWTSKEGDSKVFWPTDLLLANRQQPPTRILSFGYDAGELVVASIRSYARSLLAFLDDLREGIENRPVIFLGHCLGGLIVKQAMRFAENEKVFQSIILATKEIMFFGTPHGGGDKQEWQRLASSYGGALGPKCRMVAVLNEGAADLQEVDEDFRRLQHKFIITNFLEKRLMPGAKHLIVNETSAAKVPGDKVIDVDGDHVTMCQFKDPHNGAFIGVCRIIRRAASQSPTRQTSMVANDYMVANQQPAVDDQAVINQELVVNGRVVGRHQLVFDRQAGVRANHQGATAGGAVGVLDSQASRERGVVRPTGNQRMLEAKEGGGLPWEEAQDRRQPVREHVRSRQHGSKS
ncbi:hypothetical protein F4777DRAFT_467482 [Nemania sp. FL0916]|nr:hypothetical protein F4777DRAFT_467482 [Nemania sp. FL0916]